MRKASCEERSAMGPRSVLESAISSAGSSGVGVCLESMGKDTKKGRAGCDLQHGVEVRFQRGFNFVADRMHNHVLGTSHQLVILGDKLFKDSSLRYVFLSTLGVR